MAITTESIDALPDYTSAHQLKMWQKASIDIAAGGTSYAIAGRSLTRENSAEIRANIAFWEMRVAMDSDPSGTAGIALARFGEQA